MREVEGFLKDLRKSASNVPFFALDEHLTERRHFPVVRIAHVILVVLFILVCVRILRGSASQISERVIRPVFLR